MVEWFNGPFNLQLRLVGLTGPSNHPSGAAAEHWELGAGKMVVEEVGGGHLDG